MRIAMLTRSLPFHQSGGMEEICWDFAQSFTAMGHEVLLITTRGTPPRVLPKGLEILCLDAPGGRYSLAWWRATRRLYLQRLRHEVDVILGVGGGARALGLGPRRAGALWVTQAHGTSWGDLRGKWRMGTPSSYVKSIRNILGMLEDLTYRRCDAMIAVGQTVAEDLARAPSLWVKGGCPVHLIPNGVNPKAFAFCPTGRRHLRGKLALPESAKLVLMASRLHPQKGLQEGIAGFERAASRDLDLHLAIAGTGPLAQTLAKAIEASPFQARIHLLGHVPRPQMRDWLSAADVFLMPNLSQESGLPLSLLEAMASGLPIVASQALASLNADIIGVNPRDPDSIAKALHGALGAAAPRLSRLPPAFALEQATERYLALFQHLLDQKSAP